MVGKRVDKPPYTYVVKGKYWRFRRGDVTGALPEEPWTPRFLARYGELMALCDKPAKKKADERTWAWLCDRFEKSAEVKLLKPATQKDYAVTLSLIRAEMGEEQFRFTTKGMIKLVRDDLVETPRKANKLVALCARIYRWAEEEDLVPEEFNPAAKVSKLKHKQQSYIPWSEEEIDLFLAHADGPIRTAVLLALYTGQRAQDIVTMEWGAYMGDMIRVRQSKTGEALDIPVHPSLRRELAAVRTRFGGPIVRSRVGKPMAPHALSQFLARTIAKIEGMPNRTMHGLRYAAAARLEAAGCTVGECTAVLGHRTYQMGIKYMTQRRDSQAAVDRMEGVRNS